MRASDSAIPIGRSILQDRPASSASRLILFAMFIVLMMDINTSLKFGIGLGLSGKNLFLYLIVVMIGIKAATRAEGIRLVDLDIHAPFLILISYATLTWAISSIFDPTYSAFRGAMTMKNQLIDYYLFMFAFCYGVDSRRDYLWLLRAIIVTHFLISFVTLIDFLNIPNLGIVGTHEGRVEGLIGGVNQYAGMLAFMLPMSIAAIPENQTTAARWFWRLGIVVTGILLLATGSRGAYFATLAGTLYCIFTLRRHLDLARTAKYAVITLIVLTFIVVGFVIFNADFVQERVNKTTGGNLRSASSGRLDIWTAAIRVMAEWPMSYLVGYGWNSYGSSGIWKSAHNEYMDRLFELGVIGLAMFVYLLRSVRMRAANAIAEVDDEVGRIMIGYVFAIMIITLEIFFSSLPDTWTLIWLVTGLVMGLVVSSPREPQSAQAQTA